VNDLDRTTPERVLIHKCLNGEKNAFRLLLERHQPSVLHYARGFVASDEEARSVARRALRVGFRRLPHLRRNSLFSSFLIGVLRKELRKKGLASAPEDVSRLWAALAGLPRVQREVVFLFFQGLSIPEIARARGEPPSQTRSRLVNGLHHVAKKIDEENEENHSPSTCPSRGELILAELDAIPPERKKAVTGHAQECPVCRARAEKSGELIRRLENDIRGLSRLPPLLEQIPGPSVLSTVLAAGAILGATFLCFLLLRSAL